MVCVCVRVCVCVCVCACVCVMHGPSHNNIIITLLCSLRYAPLHAPQLLVHEMKFTVTTSAGDSGDVTVTTASGWTGGASSDLDLSPSQVPVGFVGMDGANKVIEVEAE
jgi:hypothetical protein